MIRATMQALITRTRLLINDPAGSTQVFGDQDVQDVLDEGRIDCRYLSLRPAPTYSGATVSYLDYFADDYANFEDGLTLLQYRTMMVTPATSENIVGHWTFAATTLPPVYLVGRSYDLYRSAADLLERLMARWMLSYNVVVDGQNLQRSQAIVNIQLLVKNHRMKQRATATDMTRSDLNNNRSSSGNPLGPQSIDYT